MHDKNSALPSRRAYDMMAFSDHSREPAFPELLAAYADGELDAGGCAQVEAWLAEHPDARVDLESQRQLSRLNAPLWDASAPPAPAERLWSRLFARVHFTLHTLPPEAPVAPHRRMRFGRAGALLAAAAAILFVVTLQRPEPAPTVRPISPVEEDAWVVADADDIDIQSVQEADARFLIVGVPPLTDSVVLASPGEVQLEKVAKDVDGMMPPAMAPGPNAPMLCVPMAGR